ncbi:MAG: aromatic ring-hydroxylating dioxygenase subunit alpha [Pseudomonadota bacterium]
MPDKASASTLILNTWYVAAHIEELEEGRTIGRRIADRPIVLWRSFEGTVHAFDDICPHRKAPLSMGEVTNNLGLRCPYHGFTFAGDGRCSNVPGQDKIPEQWRIEPYPIIERFGCIWIWLGDPKGSHDETSIPQFMEFGIEPYKVRAGMIPVDGDYRLLVDNLLDPTHAEFVHRTSFGSSDLSAAQGPDKADERPTEEFEVAIEDDKISFDYRLINSRGGPCFRQAYSMRDGLQDDENIDYIMHVDWQPPGLFSYCMDLNAAQAQDDNHLRLVNLHILTPETERTTHYFYRCSVLNDGERDGILDYWHEIDQMAFNEDKVIVEAQQKIIGEEDLFADRKLWARASDQMNVMGRRILKRMEESQAR